MKIAVIGNLYVNIQIDLEGEFNEYGDNKGYSVTTYGGKDYQLMMALAEAGHKVEYIGQSSTSAGYSMCRKLYDRGVVFNTIDQPGEIGFHIDYKTQDGGHKYIDSDASPEAVYRYLNKKKDGKSPLSEFDAIVLCYIDDIIWKEAINSGKSCYYYINSDYDYDELASYLEEDYTLQDMVNKMEKLTLNNFSEVLS